MTVDLFRVLLPVTDIEVAESFYAEVLGDPGQRVSPGRHYFDCGSTILACFDPAADGDGYEAPPNPEALYFAVADLAGARERCAQAGGVFPEDDPPGIGPLGEIHRRPWCEVSFYVRDPFGNQLCFVDRDSAFTGESD